MTAQESYAAYRGSFRDSVPPVPHWDDLDEHIRSAMIHIWQTAKQLEPKAR